VNRILPTCSIYIIACTAAAVTPGRARADWPNFRGPNHDGISSETGFRIAWKEPIPLLWDRNVGSAFSSFAAVGDRLYTCGTADGMQTLYCLNADTGDVIWKRPFEKQYKDWQGGDGTRATPTVDGHRVYVLGGHGMLVCADANTGSELWTKQFDLVPEWGYSGSVLIEGDLAIATGGRPHGSLVAFDKVSGEPRWNLGEVVTGYATPYPFTLGGTRYVVGFTGKSFLIADAKSGRLALEHPWETAYEVNAAQPIFHDGLLWIGSGYDTGCGLFKLTAAGDKLTAEQVWKSKVLLNKFQSAVLYEGNLYASDQKDFVCVDFLTGNEQWRQRRVSNGTLLIAGGQIVFLSENGQLQIGPAGPKGFDPTTKADILSGRCWTVPVLHNGKLYARNLERITCFDLKP
jgi:outer membrane protein assembly factor BamB